MGVAAIDVEHLGNPGIICAYLLDAPEPALVDPGPSTSLPRLVDGLTRLGMQVSDLRHVLLTHVHLDHAGGVGQLVRKNPRITVHVHTDGAPHLVDPEKLVSSTRRTFGDEHDRYWGDVLPVPADRIRGWSPGDPPPLEGIRPLPTPGHIAHHLAWAALGPGILFSGDSLGVVLGPGAPSHPPTPPPAVDLSAWRSTLEAVRDAVEVPTFAATHFGMHSDPQRRAVELGDALEDLARRVHGAMDLGDDAEAAVREKFARETLERQGAGREGAGSSSDYFSVFPPRLDWEGMRFHLSRTPVERERLASQTSR